MPSFCPTFNLVPRGPFRHALEIETPGQVQRYSGFEWLCKHNRLRPAPIRFVRLDSGHAQSDGKSVNRGLPVSHGLPVLDLAKGSQRSNDWACAWFLPFRSLSRDGVLNQFIDLNTLRNKLCISLRMKYCLSIFLFADKSLSPGQTIATCQRDISQHCWAQLVACVWPPCCDMLRGVGCFWLKFHHFQT